MQGYSWTFNHLINLKDKHTNKNHAPNFVSQPRSCLCPRKNNNKIKPGGQTLKPWVTGMGGVLWKILYFQEINHTPISTLLLCEMVHSLFTGPLRALWSPNKAIIFFLELSQNIKDKWQRRYKGMEIKHLSWSLQHYNTLRNSQCEDHASLDTGLCLSGAGRPRTGSARLSLCWGWAQWPPLLGEQVSTNSQGFLVQSTQARCLQ